MSGILQGITKRFATGTFAAAACSLAKGSVGMLPGGSWLTFVRTNVRDHFPKPKEVKRIKVHGWEKRMSTPEGRKILMRRILKGRHVLSH